MPAFALKLGIAQRRHPMAPTHQTQRQQVNPKALLRAVASSTAVETGQSIAQLEQKLQRPEHQQRFAHIKLAR